MACFSLLSSPSGVALVDDDEEDEEDEFDDAESNPPLEDSVQSLREDLEEKSARHRYTRLDICHAFLRVNYLDASY